MMCSCICIYYASIVLCSNQQYVLNQYVSHICRLPWIEVHGTTYKRGSIVVLGVDLLPKFGVVRDITVCNTDIYYFVCEILVTECFSHHFHAYQAHIQHPPFYNICKQSDLHDHTVLASSVISSQPNTMHILLQYQLIEYT